MVRRAVVWLVPVLLVAVGACRGPCCRTIATVAPEPGTSTGTTAGFEWAILPADAAVGIFSETQAGWRPEPSTVRRVLAAVPGHLEAELARTWPHEERDTEDWHATIRGVLAKRARYRCQVMGYLDGDRRLIYLNFVDRRSFEPDPYDEPEDREDWTRDPHLVDDGGDWYWQVVYDVAERRFFALSVNGEA